MKLTFQNGRVDVSGRHNDRNFDVSKAKHINAEKMTENKYWTYNDEKNKEFNKIELDFYAKHFQKYLDMQAARNAKNGHPERDRTIKKYYHAKHSRPEDKIIQIGNKDEHPDAEKLWECALEYQKRFDELYGENCKILSMALHVDEATPHIHIRRVWISKDDENTERVCESKALADMGILPNDPEHPTQKHNNPKITFTNIERELFREICREKEIELEPERKSTRAHLSVDEYKEAVKEQEELERTRDSLKKQIVELSSGKKEAEELCSKCEQLLQMPLFNGDYDETIEVNQSKGYAEKLREMLKCIEREVNKAMINGSFDNRIHNAKMESELLQAQKSIKTLEHKVETFTGFIVDNGYNKQFVDYIQQNKTELQDKNIER